MDEDIKIYELPEGDIQSPGMQTKILLHSDTFQNDYGTQRIRAEYAEAEIEGRIKNIKRDLLLKFGREIIVEETHRIKTADSTAEKMVRKEIKSVEHGISDMLGWRLIVTRPEDVPKVVEAVDEAFEVYSSKDYMNEPKPPEYGGYTGAVHKKIQYQVRCGGKLVSVKLEIQIACNMFSAFWVVEHDVNYKCSRENPHAVIDNQMASESILLLYEIIDQRRQFQENPDIIPDGSKITEHVNKIAELNRQRNLTE